MTIHIPHFLRIAVPVPIRRLFDYLPPKSGAWETLEPGMRIRVPFQRREVIGVFIERTSNTTVRIDQLKPATEIIDHAPVLSSDILQLCFWAADYYHHPIGEIVFNAMPILLRQGHPAQKKLEWYWHLTKQGLSVDLDALKKAPRQKECVELLKQYIQVTTKQFKSYNISKETLHALQKKDWIVLAQKNKSEKQVPHPSSHPFSLNAAQQNALDAILLSSTVFQVFLLNGVTGSGKTEVYLQAIEQCVKKNKQALVLIPEIGLTPQTIQRFRERFSVPVIALHSGLSEKERFSAWFTGQTNEASIIIGTRSAIFSPFKNLGLIIVDEEHDVSFKQQDNFRYHARDLAIMRAHFNNIPIILGSATPALETLYKALQGKFHHLYLPDRAGSATLPVFQIIDVRNKTLEHGMSQPLLTEIKNHLERDEQVMLFLNRRGFSPVLLCHACGWMVNCKRCDRRMTYHLQTKRLHCHHCDATLFFPSRCEACKATDLQLLGQGTERLEMVIEKYFPNASIARIDRDSTQKKGSLDALLDGIQSGKHHVLIGTQMLAKGHHFPNVTLVGIIDADGGFFSQDFRSLERMGQLLLQVAGRAGRVEKPGKVMIQTHYPDHPLLHELLNENYQSFSQTLLKERACAFFPPFSYFALFRAEAYQIEYALLFLEKIKLLEEGADHSVQLLGPIPAAMPRRAGRHRVQLLVQAKHRNQLQLFLKKVLPKIEKIPSKKHVRWSLDVDPQEMF